MKETLSAVEATFRQQGDGELQNIPRRRVQTEDIRLNVMFSANREENLLGAKLYASGSGNRARFALMLFDGSTGAVKAIMEASTLGLMRTGAASGIATKYLARQDARTVALFGAGHQAGGQLRALSLVRPLETVEVIGRDLDRLQAFCHAMTDELGLPVRPSEDAEKSVRGADIIVTATKAAQPLFPGDWVSPGTHLCAIGSNMAHRRELDTRTVERASCVVVDALDTAQLESGDLIPAVQEGILSWKDVVELGAIVRGKRAGRKSEEDITLFKSHGIAAEDVSTAARVYSLARAKGLGQSLDVFD